MSDFKSVLQKIAMACLYAGLGMLFACIYILYLMPFITAQYEKKFPRERPDFIVEYNESAKLEIEVVSEFITPMEFRLVGKVWNRGERNWSMVSLRAEVFDADGAFIGDCSEHLSQTLRAGDVRNFSMACPGGYLGIPLDKYASYTIIVADAFAGR
jgi:hypothetical protein